MAQRAFWTPPAAQANRGDDDVDDEKGLKGRSILMHLDEEDIEVFE